MNNHSEQNPLLREINRKVERALQNHEKQHNQYKHWRKLVVADERDNKRDNPRRVYPYTIFSTLSALIPALYAKNPEIEIRPDSVVVQQAQLNQWGHFAESCEALIHKELIEQTDLKQRMKSALRSALTCGVGWLKVSLQADYSEDVLMHSRQNDAQDNIARLRALGKKMDDETADSELVQEETKLQTEHVERTLRGESELFIRKGLVVDNISAEDVIVLDEQDGRQMGDYLNCQAIAQRFFMSVEDYESQFGHSAPTTARLYANRHDNADYNVKAEEMARKDKQVQVFEVWDKRTQTVFTFALGANKWAREPYTPSPSGERFFPFFALLFNEVDGIYHPLSDVQLLEDYQSEYAQMRTDLNALRRWNKPKFAVSKQGDLSANDANRMIQTLRNDDTGDWLAVSSNPTVSLAQQMQQLQIPNVNMGLFDPSMVFRDVEMATRTGDAARGFINKAKTATEAEIMSMGQQSGVSERQDILEGVMAKMAEHALQLIVQTYTPEEVAQIIGENSFWQTISIDVLFRYLNLEIKAGSMSKPNKFQEREQWTQLLPMVRETIQMMAQLQAQGMMSMAQTMKKLLQETLTRFDERIDLDEFLPDFNQDMQQQMMMQQMQQTNPTQGVENGY